MSQTTIVVPCHNEARRLDIAEFRRCVRQRKNLKFLLVNDGSRDGTLKLLEQLAAADPTRCSVLDLAHNGGKAEAIRRGVLEAAAERPDYLGFWDADLATPLDAIGSFCAVLDQHPQLDLVLGVRLPLAGHDIRRRRLRGWLGRNFARVASLALGTRFCDTQCGAKVFRATPEMLAVFSQPFLSRWIFDVEMLARLIRLRRGKSQPPLRESIYEMPLDRWEDVAGSKLKRGDFFKAVAELAAIWRRYLRPFAPPFVPAATPSHPAAHELAPTRRAA